MSSSSPAAGLGPVEHVRQFALEQGINQPTISFVQINQTPAIFECYIDAGGLKGSGLGKSEGEAEKAAYLSVYESILAYQKTLQEGPEIGLTEDELEKMYSMMPWFKTPTAYLKDISVRFNLPVKMEVSLINGGYEWKGNLGDNISQGLTASSVARNRLDAERQGALKLCDIIDEYLETHGLPLKHIDEYKDILSCHLEDRARYHWYKAPNQMVLRIASACKKLPVYKTDFSALDKDSFICTLTIDQEKGIVGHGRSYNGFKAECFASIDLCRKFSSLAHEKHNLGKDSKNRTKGNDEKITEAPDQASVAGSSKQVFYFSTHPERLNLISEPSAVSKRPNNVKADTKLNITIPMKRAAHIENISNFVGESGTEPLKNATSSPPKVNNWTTADLEKHLKKFCPSLMDSVEKAISSLELSVFLDIQFEDKNWVCRLNIKQLGQHLIYLTSNSKNQTKGPAFVNLMGCWSRWIQVERKRLEERLIEARREPEKMNRRSSRDDGKSPRKRSHFDIPAQENIVVHVPEPSTSPGKTSTIMAEVSPPNYADSTVKSNDGEKTISQIIMPGATATVITSQSPPPPPPPPPAVNIDVEYYIRPKQESFTINLSRTTVGALLKWFENERNFGRLCAISKYISGLSSQPNQLSANRSPNVSLPLLERNSTDLLENMKKFQVGGSGQQIMSYRSSLPIYGHKTEICDLINGHQVVLLSAENGYGKSTQVANYILEQMTIDGVGSQCNVLGVVGCSLAAKSLALCVAEERGEKVSDRVAFIEGDGESAFGMKRDVFGTITFCSGEAFLEKLRDNKLLYGYSHVVIDNIEEGSLENDLILHAVSQVLDKRPELRLVLLSSLIEVEPYVQYFSKRTFNALVMAPFAINIQQYFLEDYITLLDQSLVSSKDSAKFIQEELNYQHVEGTSAENDHMPYSIVEAIIGQLCKSTPANESILVFLPSGEEISTLYRFLLEDDLLKIGYASEDNFHFVFIHSHIRSLEDVYRVDYRSALPLRKIYLCTAEAESTFPITAISHVIDTCKYRPKIVEMEGKASGGSYRWISQVECVRRSRCAGRVTGNGSYYSVMSLNRFTTLEPEPTPEVFRYSPEYVGLRTMVLLPEESLSHVLRSILHCKAFTELERLEKATKSLSRMGAVRENKITALGCVMAKLAVPPKISKLILHGLLFKCIDPVLVIAAVVLVGSPFLQGEVDTILGFDEKLTSDHITILKAYNLWWDHKSRKISRPSDAEFCAKNHLSQAILIKIAQTKQILLAALMESGLVESMGRVFNRFIETAESKDALMIFLNENSEKLKLVQALALIVLFPNLAVSSEGDWRDVQYGEQQLHIQGPTCAGRDLVDDQLVCCGYGRLSQSSPKDLVSEITRASPLALALLFTPSSALRPHMIPRPTDFYPSHFTHRLDDKIFFGYPSLNSGIVTAMLKSSLEVSMDWLYLRLDGQDRQASSPIRAFSDEEIVRFIDNIIRTNVSLFDAESY